MKIPGFYKKAVFRLCNDKEFADRKDNRATLEYVIANRGMVLYEN